MTMPAKNKKSKLKLSSKAGDDPIAKGEIDVLRYLVRSELGKKKNDRENLTETSFGEINVSFKCHELFKKGKHVPANARELRLLKYFFIHEGEVLSRDQLLRDVWGFDNNPTTRSVDNYVLRLRKIIEDDPTAPRFILTVHGAGYKFSK